MNSPIFSSSGFGLDSSEKWWPRISGKMSPVHLSAVRWSLTIWPCLTSILVVRESNTSPWISLFFPSFLSSFSDPSSSPVNSVSRVCPWPWHSPICVCALLHTLQNTLRSILTHTQKKKKQMCAPKFMFDWVISHTLTYVFLCDCLACPTLAPVNF